MTTFCNFLWGHPDSLHPLTTSTNHILYVMMILSSSIMSTKNNFPGLHPVYYNAIVVMVVPSLVLGVVLLISVSLLVLKKVASVNNLKKIVQ